MYCIFARSFSIWATMFRPSIYFDLEWVSSLWHSPLELQSFYLPSGVWELCVISFSVVGENPEEWATAQRGPVVKDSANVLWPKNIWLISQTWLDTLVMLDLPPDKVGSGTQGALASTFLPLMMCLQAVRLPPQGFALDFIFYSSLIYKYQYFFFQLTLYLQHHFWG